MSVTSRQSVTKGVATQSFADFYRREWPDVVGLGYVLTGNRCVAEDLAQEGFAAAYGRWDRVSSLDKSGAWVRRVVANRSVSWFRRRAAERRALTRVVNSVAVSDLEVEAQTEEVWSAVRMLPRRQRQAIALTYFEGMTLAEVSDVMGCGPETAKTHLKRGRRSLARRLGVEEGPDA